MKHLFFGLLTVLSVSFFVSCEKEHEEITEKQLQSLVFEAPKPKKPKIKFKHACDKALGLCIAIPIGRNVDLTIDEYDEGYGTFEITDVQDSYITITFDGLITNNSDTSLDLYQNWDLGEELAKENGFDKLILKSGKYLVKTNYNNSSIVTFEILK